MVIFLVAVTMSFTFYQQSLASNRNWKRCLLNYMEGKIRWVPRGAKEVKEEEGRQSRWWNKENYGRSWGTAIGFGAGQGGNADAFNKYLWAHILCQARDTNVSELQSLSPRNTIWEDRIWTAIQMERKPCVQQANMHQEVATRKEFPEESPFHRIRTFGQKRR